MWLGSGGNCSSCNFKQYQSVRLDQNKVIQVADLGVMSYKDCWDYQTKIFDQIIATKRINRNNSRQIPTQNHLLWVEHPPVFTLGNSGNQSNMLIDEKGLKKNNIEFYKTNRGGDITFHGPGQLVCYPILDLDNFFTDIHKYLRLLEETVVLTLSEYGIEAERSKGETGVWIAVGSPLARKICAMGVRASRWVTMHGFALNVNTDLSYFDHIVPCGIQDKAVTSLHEELKKQVPIQDVKEKLSKHFQVLFNAQWG